MNRISESGLTIVDDGAWVNAYLPSSLPKGWREVERKIDGAHWIGPNKFSVIMSGCVESDGKRWLHVSCARPSYMPTWEDLRFVKETFIGRDRYAVQVLPPSSRYVNIHPFCLHLFACLDGWPLPEFSGFSGNGRTL